MSFQFHPAHRAAAYIVSPGLQAASGALADRDVARQSAARYPAPFQELARDSPSATAETAQQDAPRALPVPPPLDAQKTVKVEFQKEHLAVAQKALLVAAHRAQPSAMAVESV